MSESVFLLDQRIRKREREVKSATDLQTDFIFQIVILRCRRWPDLPVPIRVRRE
jgi:hypothetical protein